MVINSKKGKENVASAAKDRMLIVLGNDSGFIARVEDDDL